MRYIFRFPLYPQLNSRRCVSFSLLLQYSMTGDEMEYLSSFDRPHKPFYLITSVCTVDLLTPKCLAAALTVVLFSSMYSASSTARRSISDFKCTTPNHNTAKLYAPLWCKMNAGHAVERVPRSLFCGGQLKNGSGTGGRGRLYCRRRAFFSCGREPARQKRQGQAGLKPQTRRRA